jgi:hypothetical protein
MTSKAPKALESSSVAVAADIALSRSAGRRFPLLSISMRSATIPIATTPPGLTAAWTRPSRPRIASTAGRCSMAENARTRSAGVSNW